VLLAVALLTSATATHVSPDPVVVSTATSVTPPVVTCTSPINAGEDGKPGSKLLSDLVC
jgi:hypothetical protein